MSEQTAEAQERDEKQVTLSDLEVGITLPAERAQKSRRKRKAFVFFALIVLAAVTFFGGYLLLRSERVDLKASRRLQEKTSSGSDIRQAAFASISDSLITPSPAPVAEIPERKAASNVNQSEPISPSDVGGERVTAPIQPGISATLAPPPEAISAKPTPTPWTSSAGREQASIDRPSKLSTTLTTALSIRFAPTPQSVNPARAEKRTTASDDRFSTRQTGIQASGEVERPALAIRRKNIPSFGAMLPVRLMGALYTLRSGSLARFELMRDLKTDQWQMKRGTVFVGNIIGGDVDRAYVQIKGFIDPETQRLMKIEGDILGDDGGAGLRGKRRRVSPVWIKVLDKAAQAGLQIATSVLNRGASSVIIATDPYGAIRSTGDRGFSQSNGNSSFVEVPAGAVGFVMVTTLPEAVEPDSYLADDKGSKNEYADQELAELMTLADPARIRAALPRMNPELRQIAEMVIKEIEAVGK
jgi:hypothetical protein